MSDSLIGKITLPPELKTSKAGKSYTEFPVLDKKENIITCLAFGTLAEKLVSIGKMGMKLIATGERKTGGKFFLSGFSVEDEKKTETPFRKVPIPVTEMDLLMDKLGPMYVTNRLKKLFADTYSLISSKFPKEEYQKLISELIDEANNLK